MRRKVGLAFVLAVILSGCGSAQESTSETQSTEQIAAASEAPKVEESAEEVVEEPKAEPEIVTTIPLSGGRTVLEFLKEGAESSGTDATVFDDKNAIRFRQTSAQYAALSWWQQAVEAGANSQASRFAEAQALMSWAKGYSDITAEESKQLAAETCEEYSETPVPALFLDSKESDGIWAVEDGAFILIASIGSQCPDLISTLE